MTAVLLRPEATFSVEALVDDPIYGGRPRLRGRFHQIAAVASVPIGFVLVTAVARPEARSAVAVQAVTWTAMLATSAAYHRLAQSVTARFWMRRLDHSAILVHIAGVTTPLAVLGPGGSAGRLLAAVAWVGAIIAILAKLTRLTASHDPCPSAFPMIGAIPLLCAPGIAERAGSSGVLLLVASAVVYGAGATCFARKSPDPIPTVFGYHEVWHVFTLVAGVAQLALVVELAA